MPVRALTWNDVRRRRLRRHGLASPVERDRLLDLVGDVCGMHAQVAASAEMALGVRVAGLTRGDVQRALFDERTLVKTSGLRGTLHLFPTRELGLWLAALRHLPPSRPPHAVEMATLPTERVPEVVDAIGRALEGGRQMTRDELGEALRARLGDWIVEEVHPAFAGHMPRWWLAITPAALAGVLTFGPNRGSRVTYTRVDEWVGPVEPMDGQMALLEVVRRYIGAYGPTRSAELARWLNTSPAASRDLLRGLGDEIEEVDVEGWRAYDLVEVPRESCERGKIERQGILGGEEFFVHLLPRFDCFVVGSHPREQLIPVSAPKALQGGTAAPFLVLLVDGMVGGVWQQTRRGKQLDVRVGPFERLSSEQQGQLEAQVRRLGELLGVQAQLEIGDVAPKGHM